MHLFKADIDAAYRRVPIRSKHHELAHIVFLHRGSAVVSQHVGMPFGSVASVYNWNRIGKFRKLFRAHL